MVKSIAFIGDSESVKGFGAVGIETIICRSPADAPAALKAAAEKDRYAIIYMTEELFESAGKEAEKLSEKTCPAVIPLPGASGQKGTGIRRLSSFVEQAVGSDILFKDKNQ